MRFCDLLLTVRAIFVAVRALVAGAMMGADPAGSGFRPRTRRLVCYVDARARGAYLDRENAGYLRA